MTLPLGAAAPRAPAAAAPVLVALGPDGARVALDTAARLAERDGRPLAVVSAVEPPPAAVALDAPLALPDVNALVAARRESVRQRLDDAGARAESIDVAVDDPVAAIAEAARARGAAMLVIGGGRHGLAAKLFGEVAVRVARHLGCPMLATAATPTVVPPRVVVAATDFSASSVEAARAALALLAPGGTLHLVHAWQPAIAGLDADDEAYELLLPDRFAAVERALGAAARGVTVVRSSVPGDPLDVVPAYARVHGAELIAAGRQGHNVLELLLVGRVTTALLRAADCAVLVTPTPRDDA